MPQPTPKKRFTKWSVGRALFRGREGFQSKDIASEFYRRYGKEWDIPTEAEMESFLTAKDSPLHLFKGKNRKQIHILFRRWMIEQKKKEATEKTKTTPPKQTIVPAKQTPTKPPTISLSKKPAEPKIKPKIRVVGDKRTRTEEIIRHAAQDRNITGTFPELLAKLGIGKNTARDLLWKHYTEMGVGETSIKELVDADMARAYPIP